jgi:hypothetical protein
MLPRAFTGCRNCLHYIKNSPDIRQIYTCRIPTGYLRKTKSQWKSVLLFLWRIFATWWPKKKRAGESNKGALQLYYKRKRLGLYVQFKTLKLCPIVQHSWTKFSIGFGLVWVLLSPYCGRRLVTYHWYLTQTHKRGQKNNN